MAPPGLPSCGTDDVQATGKEGHRLVTNAVVHGAPPIRLSAIPLGTHLHGSFYLAPPDEKMPPLETAHHRKTPEWDFRRCIRIEDDYVATPTGVEWISRAPRELSEIEAIMKTPRSTTP